MLLKANEQAYHQSKIIRFENWHTLTNFKSQQIVYVFFFFIPPVDHLFFLFMRTNQYGSQLSAQKAAFASGPE